MMKHTLHARRACPWAGVLALCAVSPVTAAAPCAPQTDPGKAPAAQLVVRLPRGAGPAGWLPSGLLLLWEWHGADNYTAAEMSLQGWTVPLLKLTESYGRLRAAYPRSVGPCVQSPDGKRLLTYGTGGDDFFSSPSPAADSATDLLFVFSIADGKVLKFKRQHPDAIPVWMPDSRSWAELSSSELLIHPLRGAGRVRHVPVRWAGGRPGIVTGGDTQLWQTAHEASGGDWIDAAPENAMRTWTAVLDTDVCMARQRTITLPPNVVVLGFAASPDDGQIAWLFQMLRCPASEMHSLRSKFSRGVDVDSGADPDHEYGIWLTDASGGNLHEVAPLDWRKQADFAGLLWSADGSKLYFTEQDGLYMLPRLTAP